LARAATEDLLALPETTSSSRFDWSRFLQQLDGSYAVLALGPTLEHMDGNLDGRGTYVGIRHYLNFDYQLRNGAELELGGEFRQYFRPVDPRRPDRKEFEPRDPYVGISRRDLFRGDIFSLVAKAKYYLPITENNLGRRGQAYDTGRGSVQAGVGPSWKMADGSVTVTCPLDVSVNFAAGDAVNREDYSFKVKPAVQYRIARDWSAKLEYSTGDLRHNKLGKWSKFNDKDLGHKATVYASYFATKNLLLSPALAWGRDTWRLKKAEVSLYASYAFL
jgi:hypothetical protein